jgi:hypothetical protein
MQNIVLLSHIEKHALIPGINAGNYIEAMKDLMDGAMLDRNLEIFEEERKKG